ncbi:interferon-induced protein with tetratricopeptide repeats 1 [Ictidomys tridecemlineatus]|uniref:Interferon-induced protein with tetratricopeptide repeats 1 n=1 Tax=Ictidomys tridecemlineatus TaxID=43179 RepID=I3NE72_ICTTR|nr:interferon-induced protein with tetratricopeptide repeats 1 [Ictidomys tridecemlineatus]KAG3264517.1 interferon-induced protein with tetratricopeptide repeats 1 [Ictidomys tridecemlineatus]
MSENTDEIQDRLWQLRCHFTWDLQFEDSEIPNLESRILEQIEFLDMKNNVGIHNLLAYVKHVKGQDEKALQSLREAEDLVQREHADQADLRSLVTWGNCAWVYHHMGRLAEAQTYLDKVEDTCKKFASPSHYRLESPEIECEEGWALLKCGEKNYERAKACFERALRVEPENPEFYAGFAITVYRLNYNNVISLGPLRKAVQLNPDNTYVKVLLALKLQDIGQETEGEHYIEEALNNTSSQTYVFRYASKFYRRKGCVDKAIQFLAKALRATPNSAFLHHQMGLCYRAKLFQIKQAKNMQDREHVDRIVRLVIFHFEFALQQKPTFALALLHLARMYVEAKDYRKAEDSYQKLLVMETDEDQVLVDAHFYYGQFQEFQKKSEVDAIRHYLKAIKTEKESHSRNQSMKSLEKLALKKLQRNAFDLEGLSLVGFVYKLKGKINEALDYYERALSLAAGSEKTVGHGP